MEDANPYQAPSNLETDWPPASIATSGSLKLLWRGWAPVFLLNMIVPLSLGSLAADARGCIGMFVGTAVLFVMCGWLCSCQPRLARAIVRGGAPIGVAQLVPILQIIAGLAAMAIVSTLRLADEPDPVNGMPGGFLVTIITGVLLIGAALFLGLLFEAILPDRSRNRQPHDGQGGESG